MFRAFDESLKHIIPISEAKRSGVYYCPACEEKVYVRGHYLEPVEGHQRKHYAHYQSERNDCPISLAERSYEANDKSEWHKNWQAMFPIDKQEYWMCELKRWCRADVYLEEHNRVIEFQHSLLSLSEFEKRNKFYQSKGITIIWLFDFDAYKEKERIEEVNLFELEKNKPNWVNVLRRKNQKAYTLNFYENRFGTFKPQLNPNIQVFFSYTNNGSVEFRKFVYVNDTQSIIVTDCIKDKEEFICFCQSDQIFTPIEELEKAEREDEERILKEKEKKRKEAIIESKLTTMIDSMSHDIVYKIVEEPESLKQYLMDKEIDEEMRNFLRGFDEIKMQRIYLTSLRWYERKYNEELKEAKRRAGETIEAEIQKRINDCYTRDNFSSVATIADVDKAWKETKEEVLSNYKGTLATAMICDVVSSYQVKFIEFFKDEIYDCSMHNAEKIIKNMFVEEDLEPYSFESFLQEVWNRLNDRDKDIIHIYDIKRIMPSPPMRLYETFKRTQYIKQKKNKIEDDYPSQETKIDKIEAYTEKKCPVCNGFMAAKRKNYGSKYWECIRCHNIEPRLV